MAESKPITMNLPPINGIPMNILLTQQKVDELANFELHSDDVFVVSYPKSGTTWMQMIVKLILSNGVDDGVSPFTSCPWIEADEVIRKRMGKPPRDLKVHYIRTVQGLALEEFLAFFHCSLKLPAKLKYSYMKLRLPSCCCQASISVVYSWSCLSL